MYIENKRRDNQVYPDPSKHCQVPHCPGRVSLSDSRSCCRSRTGSLGSSSSSSSSSGSRRLVLFSLEDVDQFLAATESLAVTDAGGAAISLVARPLAAHIAAAPALVSLLHACEDIRPEIARVLAFGNRQRCITALRAQVLLEDGQRGVLDVTAHIGPRGRRGSRRDYRASGDRRC